LHTFVCILAFFMQLHLGSQSTICEDIGRSYDSWKMRCVRVYDNATMCIMEKKRTSNTVGDRIQILLCRMYVLTNTYTDIIVVTGLPC